MAEISLDDGALKQFVDANKAKNTVIKTRSGLNVWYRWCENINERRKIEDLTAIELNRLLSHFFMTVKKRNGEEYEPVSLTSLARSIDRFLREAGKEFCILTDREFEGCRKLLEAKRKSLRRGGKGAKLRAAEPLTNNEEECLWSSGELGDHSPLVLLHTVWFLCTMHFGWSVI